MAGVNVTFDCDLRYPFRSDGLEVFNLFIKTGFHYTGVNWRGMHAKDTICVASVTMDDESNVILMRQNKGSGGEHTEMLVRQWLQDRHADENRIQKVKIYCNYSPCSECSNGLIQFLNENTIEFEVEFVFTALYSIRRESCEGSREGCRCLYYNKDITVHERHKAGLLTLRDHARVRLAPFSDGNWDELMDILVSWPDGNAAGLRTRMEALHRMRQSEDMYLRNDFEYLMQKEEPKSSPNNCSMLQRDKGMQNDPSYPQRVAMANEYKQDAHMLQQGVLQTGSSGGPPDRNGGSGQSPTSSQSNSSGQLTMPPHSQALNGQQQYGDQQQGSGMRMTGMMPYTHPANGEEESHELSKMTFKVTDKRITKRDLHSVLDTFLRTGLHEGDRERYEEIVQPRKGAICLSVFSTGDTRVLVITQFEMNELGKWGRRGRHGEEDLCDFINGLDEEQRAACNVKVYCNFTLCNDCGLDLREALRKLNKVEGFTFSSLYKIRRPSCIRNCKSDHKILEKHETRDMNALKAFARDFSIQPFGPDEWTALEQLLND